MSGKFNDLIPPYCLGCLDLESMREFNKAVKSSDEINFQELGEVQNLMALIPSTLTIEKPGSDVKQNVARKLNKIKNEVVKLRKFPAQKKKEPEPEPPPRPAKNELESEIIPEPEINTGEPLKDTVPEESINDIAQSEDYPRNNIESDPLDYNIDIDPEPETGEKKIAFLDPMRDPEYIRLTRQRNSRKKETDDNDPMEGGSESADEFNENTSVKEFEPVIHKEERRNKRREEDLPKDYYPEKRVVPKKNSPLLIGSLILIVLILIAFVYTYMKITSDVKQYKSEVDQLKGTVKNLSMQLSSSQEIERILNSKDVRIINLVGTNLNSSGFGKIIFTDEKGTGYIQLANMPPLPDNMIYQLWINISGTPVPVGSFKPKEAVGYYSFSMPIIPDSSLNSFIVTQEPETGSKNPGDKVFLKGKY